MEGGDLVVVVVGGDEGLRGEQLFDHLHVRQVDAQGLEMLAVRAEVLAHRAHRQGPAAQQVQVVGDVAGAAAELAAHPRDQERHIQDVHLVGQDVVLELVREHHDGVVGEGTTDQCGHGGLGRGGAALQRAKCPPEDVDGAPAMGRQKVPRLPADAGQGQPKAVSRACRDAAGSAVHAAIFLVCGRVGC
jgi:hypothetical protein